MAIGYRTHSEAIVSGTTLTHTLSGAIVPGDVMLMYFSCSYSAQPAPATPSGWTAVGSSPVNVSNNIMFAAYYKVATLTDVGGIVSWTLGATSSRADSVCLVYSGVDTTTPIVTGGAGSSVVGETTSTSTHAAPNITTSVPTWIVTACADRGSSSSTDFTVPAGYTARVSKATATGGGSQTIATADSAANVGAGGPFTPGNWVSTGTGGATPPTPLVTQNAAMSTIALIPSGSLALSGSAVPYNKTFKHITGDPIDLDTDAALKMILVSGYTYSAAHEYMSDLGATELATAHGYTNGGQALASKALNNGTAPILTIFTSAAVAWTVSSATIDATGAIIVKNTGTAGTSPVLFYLDFGGTGSASTTFTINPDASNGWFVFRTS